jgi:hypothetical protein
MKKFEFYLSIYRKLLLENGKAKYKQPSTENRQSSPNKDRRSSFSTLRSCSTLIPNNKANSTIDVNNAKLDTNINNLRNDFGLFDTKKIGIVEFEEENDRKFKLDDDEESVASWKKKSESDESSDSFRKPVDFGIDKETSFKLDKLNLMLMVGKDSIEANLNRNSIDSLPTTSHDNLDSPTRNYVKAVLGGTNKDNDDLDYLKKSYSQYESIKQTLSSSAGNELKNRLNKNQNQSDFDEELKLLQESVERFFL